MKILLLDTNFSSGPIYNYLVESGNEVYVIGNNPNDFLKLPRVQEILYGNHIDNIEF